MARSRRRTPIGGNTIADSDKAFKTISHRQERVAVRNALSHEEDAPHPRTFGDPWKSEKDGKRWFGSGDRDRMRK